MNNDNYETDNFIHGGGAGNKYSVQVLSPIFDDLIYYLGFHVVKNYYKHLPYSPGPITRHRSINRNSSSIQTLYIFENMRRVY